MPDPPPNHGPIGDGARISNLKDGSIRDLFIAEESPLLRYAYGLCGRRAIAEELVQEVFLLFFNCIPIGKPSKIREPGYFAVFGIEHLTITAIINAKS